MPLGVIIWLARDKLVSWVLDQGIIINTNDFFNQAFSTNPAFCVWILEEVNQQCIEGCWVLNWEIVLISWVSWSCNFSCEFVSILLCIPLSGKSSSITSFSSSSNLFSEPDLFLKIVFIENLDPACHRSIPFISIFRSQNTLLEFDCTTFDVLILSIVCSFVFGILFQLYIVSV